MLRSGQCGYVLGDFIVVLVVRLAGNIENEDWFESATANPREGQYRTQSIVKKEAPNCNHLHYPQHSEAKSNCLICKAQVRNKCVDCNATLCIHVREGKQVSCWKIWHD